MNLSSGPVGPRRSIIGGGISFYTLNRAGAGGVGGHNDTLVVETKNFKERTGLYGGDAADDGNRQQREHFVGRLPKNGKPACFPRLPVHVALAHELIDLVTDARAR